ncbi:hypothetical protein Psta_4576 [Pirellula staleyi DSM 6068]|uniref:Secreted protein n=1 Tax=Pirellula staleyi (strain ATCC 27377 / DSM 6068 / ICPB 4128) TaxID=530564 RepID=D2R715_PIRSD|nr:hypothetical protein [Pirellula staleyi]ADB19218.1 hypothetical protein Psta_4576 [Pirellula staleyi DSM 6068]
MFRYSMQTRSMFSLLMCFALIGSMLSTGCGGGTPSGPVVATPDDEKALAEEQQRAAEAEAQRMQTSGS